MTTRRGWRTATEILTDVEARHGIHYDPDILRVWRSRAKGFKGEWADPVGRMWLYNERRVLAWMAETKRLDAKLKGG